MIKLPEASSQKDRRTDSIATNSYRLKKPTSWQLEWQPQGVRHYEMTCRTCYIHPSIHLFICKSITTTTTKKNYYHSGVMFSRSSYFSSKNLLPSSSSFASTSSTRKFKFHSVPHMPHLFFGVWLRRLEQMLMEYQRKTRSVKQGTILANATC